MRGEPANCFVYSSSVFIFLSLDIEMLSPAIFGSRNSLWVVCFARQLRGHTSWQISQPKMRSVIWRGFLLSMV